MKLRILVVDDDPTSVAPLREEVTKQLTNAECKIVNFGDVEDRLEDYEPQIVVLDLLRGLQESGEPAGLDSYNLIWEKQFCPLIVYTAVPDMWNPEHNDHPLVSLVQKGAGSEEVVLDQIRQHEPYVLALAEVAKEIRVNVNTAVRDVAPRIFANRAERAETNDMLIRATRRRVAARMDEALSFGGAKLKSWEFYLCPPVGNHPLTGDIVRRRNSDADAAVNYAIILTPSCDLATNGTRSAKVSSVLVSRCDHVTRLLQDLSISDWKPKHKEKLRSCLTEGHTQSCLPLPGLPGVFPSMAADLRKLELIGLTSIGDVDADTKYERIASVDNPMRELVAWAYTRTAGRPGLPDRDFDAWADEIEALLV